ncbi:MAG: alpha-hydroxy-acid oxidizing protein [Saprospiraceae bacterium]|nr:alpha-hydroxy-acid oxidizing protein [Saprospiraceae bacterium]
MSSSFNPSDRQKEIYTEGALGHQPKIPVDFKSLELQASKILSKNAFGYIATGAGQEEGIFNNQKAFSSWNIIPSIASGIQNLDTKRQILGLDLPWPMMFAPIGVLDLARPKGDLLLAKASVESQIPMIISNQASTSMEEVAKALTSQNFWFQLYFSKSKELVRNFVQRAEACGAKGIILTLDTTTLGWRQRDLNNAYLPFIRGLGIAQYTSDPVFKELLKDVNLQTQKSAGNIFQKLRLLHELLKNYPGSYFENLKSKEPIKAVRKFIEIYSRPELNWDDIQWLKEISNIPVLLKGILHPNDALQAIKLGIDGIVISNHGGRQIDRVISSLDALVEIKKVVPKDYPLILDSGIRTGTDIFMALALGAKTVLLGRPYVYALAINGSKGVLEITKNILAEFEITMKLAGCPNIESITEEKLVRK